MTDQPSGMRRTVIDVLEQYEITYHHEENGLLWFTTGGTTGSWQCRIEVQDDEEWRCVSVVSIAPVAVPEARRSAVSEWIIRKNYDTRFGSFQMDLRDGEVLYKTELIVADGVMTPAMFGHILDINWHLLDSGMQDLMAVAFGGADPAAVGGAMEVEEEPEVQKLQ